ncbi:MAG: hypothetical protein ACLPUG_11565 [Acidimicrobiales bacterium]
MFAVATIVAVAPVLYGTLRHRQWEEAEQASLAQGVSTREHAQRSSVPVVDKNSDDRSHFETARLEAVALLERLEELRDFFTRADAHVLGGAPEPDAGG